MRILIPLVPIAIVLERRPLGPFRPRLTLRGLLVVVALLAVYLAQVTLPARRQRFQKADEAVRREVEALRRVAREERSRERSIRGLFEKDMASAEREEREAAKWAGSDSPEAAEKREYHEGMADLWLVAARKVPRNVVDQAARRADALERRAGEIEGRRRQAAGQLFGDLERVAREARELPTTREWKKMGLDAEVADARARIFEEEQARAVQSFLASRGQEVTAWSGGQTGVAPGPAVTAVRRHFPR